VAAKGKARIGPSVSRRKHEEAEPQMAQSQCHETHTSAEGKQATGVRKPSMSAQTHRRRKTGVSREEQRTKEAKDED